MIRDARGRHKEIDYKGPVDIVTATDRDVEALITGELQRHFPQHCIVAEEASAQGNAPRPPAGAPTWFLDPVDGTVNFAHSVPHFAVSLGFAEGGRMQLGIVHDPMRGETFFARRGGGATLNGKPIRVSRTARLEHALLATGFPYDRRERSEYYLALVGEFMRRARDLRRFGSASLDLCFVACGRFDGYWELGLKPWDIAAASLIVSEAGGAVSDARGNPLDLFGAQILASNGALHDSMRDVLSRRLI
jgi:myo-inositol-1(or 4)-monophosphatase